MTEIRRKQLGTRVDSELHRKLRILAAREGVSLTTLVEEAIRDLIRARRREMKKANASKS